jgi:VanZ family protein
MRIPALLMRRVRAASFDIVAAMLRRATLWLPPLIYMIAIFHFSSESQPLPQLTAHVWDKALHTIEYTGLAVLVIRAILGEGVGRLPAVVLTIVVVSSYGASDEWHQSFVPMRDADVRDWVVDTIGAAVGSAAYLGTVSRRPPRR